VFETAGLDPCLDVDAVVVVVGGVVVNMFECNGCEKIGFLRRTHTSAMKRQTSSRKLKMRKKEKRKKGIFIKKDNHIFTACVCTTTIKRA
jgi:hypothetical protein